jgi:glycosyltransferase involved in cell wall biosynthesis
VAGWKLVIAGDADHQDDYSKRLKEQARQTPDVVLTGFLTGRPLAEIYTHAGLFVLPSYYEGLPIVLLEAMSYGLSCVVSDIPANREVALDEGRYFKPGDIDGMAKNIGEFLPRPLTAQEKSSQIKQVAEKYNWDTIAGETLKVYRKISAPAR